MAGKSKKDLMQLSDDEILEGFKASDYEGGVYSKSMMPDLLSNDKMLNDMDGLMNARITPEWIDSLKENEVFVFGSNLAGMHGGGAARVARPDFDIFGCDLCNSLRIKYGTSYVGDAEKMTSK